MFSVRLIRYLLLIAIFLVFINSVYMFTNFLVPGIFSSNTMALIVSSTMILFAAFLLSLPRFERIFARKISESTSLYWIVTAMLVAISIGLLLQGVASGGVDYANYMEQSASG